MSKFPSGGRIWKNTLKIRFFEIVEDLGGPKWSPTIYWYFRRKKLLIFPAVIITGIFDGKYEWYFRREILLVFSAGNITGNVGGNYYWYGRR